jgi:hypothetical protein
MKILGRILLVVAAVAAVAAVGALLLVLAMSGVLGDPLVWQR